MEVAKIIRELIENTIQTNGYILDDVQYIKEDKTYFLRIIIDKQSFINIEDCVKVTKLINPIIDKADLINESYILDVCSKEKGREENEQQRI